MLLVIGGIASGKRSFVRSRGFEDRQMSSRLSSGAPVLLDLDELLREGPIEGPAWDEVLSKQVIVCCEVGMGVVPIDAGERAWRERVGRTCARLAAASDEVVRMVCGIPVKLK
ncbi:MAG: bifunctional adenosylcobinamide kinase/adenosylcobinamide-phosphate guanylyltransferase [Atopobiaceae bacterium]|nr:bifunctional adenosylcobinamide kinase/adenosylcobinamide-phosphate guanylyltransferase [Atopobiaceae bacterium]